MKAYLRSARIAPKKANLIAKMVRGMPVPLAMNALKRTHKKGARMVEELLKSAVANAEHNDKQDATLLVIKTIVVNQGTSYRRGTPMARGRMRPMRKFLSHISLTLGIAEHDDDAQGKKQKGKKTASQGAKNPVKTSSTRKTKAKGDSSSLPGAAPSRAKSGESSDSSGSSVSS
jgi:large subunit ribosomal protein L22